MTFNPQQIDRITDELRSFLRVEVRSRKPKKLDPAFYRNINSALETLKDEAQTYLKSQDIDNYIMIKERISDIERDFRAFFQKRFEKISTLSLYDLDGETLGALTPEEKDFITRLHNLMYDEFNVLLNKVSPAEEVREETEEIVESIPEPEAAPEAKVPPEEIQPEEIATHSQFVVVRILGDQPPIAQPERDYFLHDNDIIYIPDKFAELLIKRKAAQLVNLK
jgi:DNA replication factor GINS